MIIRFPRALAHFRKPRLSRNTRLVLLVLAVATLAEIYVHTRQFAVQQSTRNLDEPFYTSCQEPAVDAPRENAAIVMLVRNSELEGALKTVHSLERHFNRWFHYPMVFLNDEPFGYDFQRAMNESTSGGARFELIPKEEWSFPEWMDERAAKKSIAAQGRAGIMYAGMESYHHMCRFYSGKFYTLEALRDYKWYWRIEPDVDFYCSISYDPFVEMARHDKVYGFTISLVEGADTCPTLFREVSDWKEKHGYRTTELWKAMVSPSWVPWPFRSMMSWLRARDSKGDSWSLCHYWSNFEIADLDFFRGQDYQSLFDHLDRTGGFYYERVRTPSSLTFCRYGKLTPSSGATPRCIPSPSACSLTRTRSTILRTSGTATTSSFNVPPTPGAASAGSRSCLDRTRLTRAGRPSGTGVSDAAASAMVQ